MCEIFINTKLFQVWSLQKIPLNLNFKQETNRPIRSHEYHKTNSDRLPK